MSWARSEVFLGHSILSHRDRSLSWSRSWSWINLWPTVSRPVQLDVGPLLRTDFNFFEWQLLFFFLHVRPPLWREDRSVMRSAITHWLELHRTITIYYCLMWDSSNLEGQVPTFISPMNRVVQSKFKVMLTDGQLSLCRVHVALEGLFFRTNFNLTLGRVH
jgi:hypothetical protein